MVEEKHKALRAPGTQKKKKKKQAYFGRQSKIISRNQH